MEVVDLMLRTKLATKQRQSNMGKGTRLRRTGRPIFSLHYAIVRGLGAEQDALTLIVGAGAIEPAHRATLPLKW